MVPNSNGRKPLTTTTATLASMAARPRGTRSVTNRHEPKYARCIGRISLNIGVTATGRAGPSRPCCIYGRLPFFSLPPAGVLDRRPGPPGPRRGQRDELREHTRHRAEAFLWSGRVRPGAGHVRRVPAPHAGHVAA